MIFDLQLNNKTVIVIGGGIEGSRKIRGFPDQGCRIIVVTNRIDKYLSSMQSQHKIDVTKSRLIDVFIILNNFKNIYLIIAATNNKKLNRTLVDMGHKMHAIAYVSDDPQYSDFTYLSLICLGEGSQVGFSTSGRSPIVSRRIGIRAERALHRIDGLHDKTE